MMEYLVRTFPAAGVGPSSSATADDTLRISSRMLFTSVVATRDASDVSSRTVLKPCTIERNQETASITCATSESGRLL